MASKFSSVIYSAYQTLKLGMFNASTLLRLIITARIVIGNIFQPPQCINKQWIPHYKLLGDVLDCSVSTYSFQNYQAHYQYWQFATPPVGTETVAILGASLTQLNTSDNYRINNGLELFDPTDTLLVSYWLGLVQFFSLKLDNLGGIFSK